MRYIELAIQIARLAHLIFEIYEALKEVLGFHRKDDDDPPRPWCR